MVPVDLSTTSRVALRYASHLARWFGVDLSILYATDYGSDYISPSRAVLDVERRNLRDERERTAVSTIGQWCKDLPEAQQLAVRIGIVDEGPTDAILERSTRHDFLVVGTRHVHEDHRPDWTSVTNQVIRRSFRPVFVVREGMKEAERPLSDPPATSILLAVDTEDMSDAEFLAASELSVAFNAKVMPLCVVPTEAEISEAKRTLSEAVTHFGMNTEFAAVVTGKPADEITKFARRWQCDLIVLSTHGRRGIGRLLLGSVAEGVLSMTPCPVLALRDPERRRTTFQRSGNVHKEEAI